MFFIFFFEPFPKGWTAAITAVSRNHVESVRILLTIPNLNWNLRTNENSDGPHKSALTIALKNGNKEIINLVLSARGLKLDEDHLMSQDVFDKAVTACHEFVLEKMGDDKKMITSFALEHDLKEECQV